MNSIKTPDFSVSMGNGRSVGLFEVIDADCCIGCGLCAFAAPDNLVMEIDNLGRMQPMPVDGPQMTEFLEKRLLDLCPFSNQGLHENELSRSLYSKDSKHHEEIGYFQGIFAGHVLNNQLRMKASSGGLISWTCIKILEANLADAVIHVTPCDTTGTSEPLFRYSISRNADEVASGGKSKYHPIELSAVLKEISLTPGRYVLVGLPCFIKGVRRLSLYDPIIRNRIVYTIGLVCGHLKSRFFAELLASQLKVGPEEIESFDFRVKLSGRHAGAYGVNAVGNGTDNSAPSADLFGTDWGLHMFRYGACDFCDDVFAETADMVVGDAWLPAYLQDWRGNSLVVVRDSILLGLLESGAKSGDLSFDRLSPEEASESQRGGLRDRREDILWRLEHRKREGRWAPIKRDFGNPLPPVPRRRVIETRVKLREASLTLWSRSGIRGNPQRFIKALNPLLKRYRKQTLSFKQRLRAVCRRLFASIK